MGERGDRQTRVTPKRVAELREEIAAVNSRVDTLERQLERALRRAELGFALARGRIGAELEVLRQAERP